MPPKEQVDDNELWRRAQLGDGVAFAALFERYCDLIYNFAYRRTGSWDAADEAVAVVFAEAWRQRDVVRLHELSLRPWLLGVAGNVVRRRWRSLDRSARAIGRLQHSGITEDHADEVAQRVDDERRLARVLDELEGMKEDHREVLLLWAWEELSYDEISLVLEIPVGTVRSRLSRARAALASHEGTATRHRAFGGDASARPPLECYGEGG